LDEVLGRVGTHWEQTKSKKYPFLPPLPSLLDEVPPEFKFFFFATSQFDWPIAQKKMKLWRLNEEDKILPKAYAIKVRQLSLIGCMEVLFLKLAANIFGLD
jgi:hypothetical protein